MSWIQYGERRIYRDAFDERARRAAALLESLGVAAADGVALCLRNDIAFFEASFGAGMLGAYTVPLNWHCTPAEAEYIMRDSGVKVLVIHSDLYARISTSIPESVVTLIVPTPAEIMDAHALDREGIAGHEESWEDRLAGCTPFSREPAIPPSTIIYTSGTTGKPKGVKRPPANETQRRSLWRMLALSYGFGEYIDGPRDPDEIVTAAIGPLYHAAPNVHSSFTIRIGANLIIEPRFDAEHLLQMIERERITHLNMVPIMFVRLLRLPQATRSRYDLSSLRYVAHAAAPCPAPVKRAMIDWWGPIIHEYYGTTELGNVTWLTSEEWLAHPGSVGRAMPDTIVRIVDDEGNAVPAGTIGEIFARRANDGNFTYNNDPAKRAAAERDGLLSPGDIGYLDEDGFLYLCDRKADLIISGGANIYPAEIEGEILRRDGVADCAVFGIPDDEFGEAVYAMIQCNPGVQIDPTELRSGLRVSLAGYKVPKHIEFVDDLPREDSGKIFKRKLRDRFWKDREIYI